MDLSIPASLEALLQSSFSSQIFLASSILRLVSDTFLVLQLSFGPLLIQSLGWEDSLEEGMATYFSILAWKIPWTEESGGLQSIEAQRVGHD